MSNRQSFRRIEEGFRFEHSEEQSQKTVRHTSKRASVRVSFRSQCRVLVSARRVFLDADSRPVINSISEPLVARLAHDHVESLSASLRDRSNASVGTQGHVVSFCERLRGFREHRGGDKISHSGQGEKDFGVTVLFRFWRGLRESIHQVSDLFSDGVHLGVNDSKLRYHHSPMCDSGGNRARCHGERRLPDDSGNIFPRESSDSVTREKSSEGREFQASSFLGISGNLEELPEPSLVGRRAQFQKVRSIPHELLPELVHQPVSALREIVIDSAQSPKPDHVGLVELHSPEARHIGSKRVGEDKGIEPIVLGASNGVPIPETVKLLGIDRVNVKASLDECLHQGPSRNLDGDSDEVPVFPTGLFDERAHVMKTLGRVLETPPANLLAVGGKYRNLMRLGSPIDSNEVSVLLFHDFSPSQMLWPAPMRPRPCTGARSADFPLEAHQGRIFWGTGPPQATRSAGGNWLLPEDGPGLTIADQTVGVRSALEHRLKGYRGARVLP